MCGGTGESKGGGGGEEVIVVVVCGEGSLANKDKINTKRRGVGGGWVWARGGVGRNVGGEKGKKIVCGGREEERVGVKGVSLSSQ